MSRKKNNNHTPSPTLLKDFKPRTRNQAEYVRCMAESDITFCSGPAATGKTACSIGLAVQYLILGKISYIVITRPMVEASSKNGGIGALPGDIQEKYDPYLGPMYDELESYLGTQRLNDMMARGTISFEPFEFMRGATFEDTFVILDEGQNATYKQLKMFITRLGKESKMVISGDTEQGDLPEHLCGGLSTFMTVLGNMPGVSTCITDESDNQRHGILTNIMRKLGEYERNKKR